MNELCKKIILTIFIFCLCYIILKNISTTNKIIEGKRGRRGRGRGRGRGRSFFKKIKIFKGRKKKNKKTSPRPPTLPTPPTPPPLLSKYPLLCSIDPKYKNRRTYKPNSKWTSIDDMNKAYGLTHITRNDLNNKLDINKIFHNYQGNNINVDYIYSFGKKDKLIIILMKIIFYMLTGGTMGLINLKIVSIKMGIMTVIKMLLKL